MSGLEAIGVAASIIQVADLGTKLSVKLFSFYRRVKDAKDTIQLLSSEVALVSAILRELGDSLKEEDSSKLCSDEAFRTLNLILVQCRDILGQIQKMVDDNDQPEKSRFQQVTGKFRIVLLEPSLDRLKINLERLKSTMLLLLNVIMYAGQIRSNNVPTLIQEQRDLIQNLLKDRQIENPKLRQSGIAAGASPGLSTLKTRSKLSHTNVHEASNQQDKPVNRRSTFNDQAVQSSTDFEQGSSIQIDHSLFAERKTESPFEAKVADASLEPTEVLVNMDCIESDESDVSETDLFPRRQNYSAASVTSSEAFPKNRDYELIMSQRHIERDARQDILERNELEQIMLEKSDIRQDMEMWRQQQEVERLERQLERHRERSSFSRLAREEKGWSEGKIEDVICRPQRLESKTWSEKNRNKAEHWSQSEKPEEVDKDVPEKEVWKMELTAGNLDITKKQEEQTQSEQWKVRIIASERQKTTEKDEKEIEEGTKELEPEMNNAVAIEWKLNQEVIKQEKHPQPSGTDEPSKQGGDDSQNKISTLPDNMEDLLARWTTLSMQEIQRGPFSDF